METRQGKKAFKEWLEKEAMPAEAAKANQNITPSSPFSDRKYNQNRYA
jgi:hypothetical protein